VTGLWTGQSGAGFPADERDFSPECPDWLWGFLIQWIPEALSAGYSGQDVMLTTHHCLMLMLRMSRAVHLNPV